MAGTYGGFLRKGWFFLRIWLVCSLCSPGASLAAAPDASRPKEARPNLILILADDLGYNNLGCYGQTRIQTPELDAMAAAGLRFTHFYSGAPLCLPARASLMTGLHLGHSRVRMNGGNGIHAPLQAEDTALPVVLRQAGYRTGLIGKWALGDAFLGNTDAALDTDGPGAVYKHGWDYYLGEPNQTLNHQYYPNHIYRFDPTGLLGLATPPQALVPFSLADDPDTSAIDESYTTDLYLQNALAFLEASRDRPFFLMLALQTPHKEFIAPEIEPYAATQSWSSGARHFASMITRMDRGVGRLLDRLIQLGMEQQTLVIFTSDNGGLADFDSTFDNNGNLPGFKGELSDGGLRVPCLAWWPGTISPGLSSQPLYFPDFLPTFAALAGIFPPEPIDGISFVPTLLGQPGQQSHDYLFFLDGSNTEPAQQAYRVINGPGETRTDAEIYAAAFRAETTVPVFSGHRTALQPSVLYPESVVPPPALASISPSASGSLRLLLEVPPGVACQLQTSSNLVSWLPAEGDWLLDSVEQAAGTAFLHFDLRPPEWDTIFVRSSSAAYRLPRVVPENPSGSGP